MFAENLAPIFVSVTANQLLTLVLVFVNGELEYLVDFQKFQNQILIIAIIFCGIG